MTYDFLYTLFTTYFLSWLPKHEKFKKIKMLKHRILLFLLPNMKWWENVSIRHLAAWIRLSTTSLLLLSVCLHYATMASRHHEHMKAIHTHLEKVVLCFHMPTWSTYVKCTLHNNYPCSLEFWRGRRRGVYISNTTN